SASCTTEDGKPSGSARYRSVIDWGSVGVAVPNSVGVSCGRADSTRYVKPLEVSASVNRLDDSGSNRTFLMPSRCVGLKAAGSQIEDFWVTAFAGARLRTPVGRPPLAGLYVPTDDQILPSNLSRDVMRQ